MRIRRATSADLEQICAVHKASVYGLCKDAYPAQALQEWVGWQTPEFYQQIVDAAAMFVAEKSGRVVGFGTLNLKKGELVQLFVEPGHAGSGIGRKLMQAMETTARQAGLQVLKLRSTLNAEPFYARHGYVATCTGTYRPRPESPAEIACVVMEKPLG